MPVWTAKTRNRYKMLKMWNRNSFNAAGMQNCTTILDEFDDFSIYSTLLPTQEWKLNPTQICSIMFVTTLFIAAQTCKQPRYPSVGVWNKRWHIQKMDYSRLKIMSCQAMKRDEENLSDY